MKRPTRYPALEYWRAELRAGERTPTDFDPLARAACAEMWAIEHDAAGLPAMAEQFRRESRAIILRAAQEQERQQRESA